MEVDVHVCVVCGPVYTSDDTLRIGHHGVAVPDACFKALLVPKDEGFSAIAFVMRNGGEDRTLAACACTVDELESLLSRDFFCNQIALLSLFHDSKMSTNC